MNFFMTKCKYFLIIPLVLLFQCADWRVATKAIKHQCNVPSTNHAFLEIASIQPTGTTKDLQGFYKYFTYIFKQPFFDVEDRCKHTKMIIDALYDNEDHKIHSWNNSNKKTSGKMAVFLTREYYGKICRDYYTIISNDKKKYFWQGTACMGGLNQLSKKYITYNSNWVFYNYKTNQSAGRPILESWETYNDVDHPSIRQKMYHFHCSKKNWRCG